MAGALHSHDVSLVDFKTFHYFLFSNAAKKKKLSKDPGKQKKFKDGAWTKYNNGICTNF